MHATLVNIKRVVPTFNYVVKFHHFLTQKKDAFLQRIFLEKLPKVTIFGRKRVAIF
jgi:hypothetical protein